VQFRIKGLLWPEKYQSALLDCELHLADPQAFSRECLLSVVNTDRIRRTETAGNGDEIECGSRLQKRYRIIYPRRNSRNMRCK
jgi:hypothetical protein